MATTITPIQVSCAVEVFLATAALHQKYPARDDFEIQEIVNQAAVENLYGTLRSGINVHASQHCVANKSPNPAKHRMLFATGKHTRRLLLPGDEAAPGRTGKIFPDEDEIPQQFHALLEWSKKRYEKGQSSTGSFPVEVSSKEPDVWLGEILKLRLSGAHLADGTDPDEHVRQLREGWD